MSNKKNKINEGFSKEITRRILANNGAGFVLQISPEIILYQEFKETHSLLNSDKIVWKRKTIKNYSLYDEDSANLDALGNIGIDWREFENNGSALPSGVFIRTGSLEVLRDDLNGIGVPKSRYDIPFKPKMYIEGRRQYLVVTEEYAEKVFREEYADEGFPFRDLLLSKHTDILNKISQDLIKECSFVPQFEVLSHAVYIDGHSSKSYQFEKMGNAKLDSIGKQYGMALALIETIKNSNTKYSNYITHITDNIHHYEFAPSERCIKVKFKKPQEVKEIKEW